MLEDARRKIGRKRRGGISPPNYPLIYDSFLRRLFFIVHTPDKVLVDLKIVTDDTIVEVYVPRAERILFMLGCSPIAMILDVGKGMAGWEGWGRIDRVIRQRLQFFE